MSARKVKFVAKNAQETLIAALDARIAAADNANQAKNLKTERDMFAAENMIAVLTKVNELQVDLPALAAQIAVTKTQDKHAFVAVYALQKVRKMIVSLGQGIKNVDGYSNSIITNLVSLQSLANKSARMSICKAIEYDEIEMTQTIKRLHNCSESTASTQASSTRMMLKVLNIANVQKGKNGDVLTLADTPVAAAVVDMFTVKS